MGDLSARAQHFHSMYAFDNNMSSKLMVEVEGKIHSSEHTYGSGTLVHVEDMLLHQLDVWWGYAEIPANAKIVLYGNWSPCKHCISDTIPRAFAKMRIEEKNLRLRFRFNHYYTQENWQRAGKQIRQEGGGRFFWANAEEADNAYLQLAAPYGKFATKNISTAEAVMSSTSPRVAFIQGLNRSRSITTWSEVWRDKIF